MLDLIKKRNIKVEIKGINGIFEYEGVVTLAMLDVINSSNKKHFNTRAVNVEELTVGQALELQDKVKIDIVELFLKDKVDEFIKFVEDNEGMTNIIYDYIYNLILTSLNELENEKAEDEEGKK